MAPETQVPTAVTEKLEQALVKKIDAGEVELPLLPQVSIAQTRVEVLGANVVRVTATCLNRGYLASMPEMGQVNGQAYPLQIALTAPANTKFLRGSPRQRVPRLTGNGGSHEASWLLRLPGPPPASLKLQLSAPAVGTSSVDLEIKGG